MSVALAQIWRYPIKGIGAEQLDRIELLDGKPLPLDRAWAVLEQGGETSEGWRTCRNFLRGAKGPALMAVSAEVTKGQIKLSHPDLEDISVPLNTSSGEALISWVSQIYPDHRAPGAELVKAPEIGMADAPFASVSVLNLESLRAVSEKAGTKLDPRRFRGNLWLSGLVEWGEFDLVGKVLCIGAAKIEIIEPITRCRATEANPETGHRDVNTLDILQQGWDHQDFGVYGKVTQSGEISVGDRVAII